MKMKKNILSAFLLSTLCFQATLANTSYVNLCAEDEATIVTEDDFTTTKLDNSKAIEKVGVGSDGNEHGLVPGAWGGNVTIADESYLVYKLDASENKEFNTLKLDINAKIWNQNDGTAHEVNAIKVFVSEDNVTFSEVKRIGQQGGDFVNLEQIDLSSYANNKKSLYVKIQLIQSTSIGESQELAWLGVKIGKIKFSLTENDYVGPVIEYSHIKDDFTTESDFLNAYKMVGVSNSSSKDHGLVPGNWDANITIADESYLMYKIIADEGVFSSLSLSINAKIWNQNDGTAHNENSIKIYAGLKENNLKEVQTLGLSSGHNMANEFKDFNAITLDSIATGEHTLYVKITLNQSTSIGDVQDLWMVGVKLGSVDFKYSQEEAEFINITYKGLNNEDLFIDNKQVKNTILNGFIAPEVLDYTFSGWYLDETFKQELTTDYRPTGDTCIYAKYIENEYEIVYMLDGGVNDSLNPTSFTAKDNITLKDPTKDGYTFKGWYSEPTFEEISKVNSINGEIRSDIILFAKFEKNSEEPSIEPSNEPSSEPSIEPSSEIDSELSSESSSDVINSSTSSSSEEKPSDNKKGCKGKTTTTFGIIAVLSVLLLKKRKN